MKRTLSAIVLTVGVSLGAAACFSKPGFTGGGGDGDAGVDAPGDAAACTPGSVAPLAPVPKSFTRLSAGAYHTCGIDDGGRMWCWGSNDDEALGRPQPPLVSGVALQVGTDAGWTDVSVGDGHACGVRAGNVHCWGRDAEQQVAPGGTSTPKGVTAVTLPLAPTIERVFAGPTSTCAIAVEGAAWCWGRVNYEAASPSIGPTALVAGAAVTTWTDIALAADHACAVSTGGEVYCWGNNDRLQLGVSTTARLFTTAVARPDIGYTRVAAAELATCAIRAGALVCWGALDHGHLGEPPQMETQSLEVIVDATETWTEIELGHLHACALDDDAQVTCYGTGLEGALGNGEDWNTWDLATPVALPNVARITVGREYSCALDTAGAAFCWGSNVVGQAGTGLVSRKLDPSQARLPVGSCERVQEIVAGGSHGCALIGVAAMPGHAYCWGYGGRRQVDGTTEQVLATPVLVTRADGSDAVFTQLVAGQDHTCGLFPDGALQCWGNDDAGELGTSTSSTPGRTLVAPPSGTTAWTQIAAGATSTCGIAGNRLYCWGSIPGTLDAAETPQLIGDGGVSDWIWESIDIGSTPAGTRFVLGVMRDAAGTRQVVGVGEGCSLGLTASTTLTPVAIPGLEGEVVTIAPADSGGGHACAVSSSGGAATLRCWGPNDVGQALGIQTQVCAAPAVMAGAWRAPEAGVASIAAGAGHTVAINGDGALAFWGENYGGQCGRAQSSPQTPAVFSPSGARYVEVATSRSFTCAIDDTRGAVWCWGRNDYAQLGDGARDYFVPHPAGTTLP